MYKLAVIVVYGQTDRVHKKPEPDFLTLIFVSFNRNRIFKNAIRLGIKRIPDYPLLVSLSKETGI